MQSSSKMIETVVEEADSRSTILQTQNNGSSHEMTEEDYRNEIREVLNALHEAAREHLSQRQRHEERVGEIESSSREVESAACVGEGAQSRRDACRRTRRTRPPAATRVKVMAR